MKKEKIGRVLLKIVVLVLVFCRCFCGIHEDFEPGKWNYF